MISRARWAQLKEHVRRSSTSTVATAVISAVVLLAGALRHSRLEVARVERGRSQAVATAAGQDVAALHLASGDASAPRRTLSSADVPPPGRAHDAKPAPRVVSTTASTGASTPHGDVTVRGYDATAPPGLVS